MRGLPPDPPDSVRMITYVRVDDVATCSFGLSILAPGIDLAASSDLQLLLTSFQVQCSTQLFNCMHQGAQALTSRLVSYRPGGPRWETSWAPNAGRWTGGQASAIAAGLYTQGLAAGKGTGSRIRLVGCPDIFIDANRELNTTGTEYLRQLGVQIKNWAGPPSPYPVGPVIIGTIQRQSAGAPLPTATFDPATAIVPARRVEVVRRRLAKRR